MTKDCLFCRIVAREIPATIVDETPGCVAFRDVNPAAPVHILVIPKKHIGSLVDSNDPPLLGEMLDMVRRLAVKEGISERGYRTVFNTGADGGQSVFHLHAHLIGGRKLSWPPG
jgi:histidine triad (HIT) family protein